MRRRLRRLCPRPGSPPNVARRLTGQVQAGPPPARSRGAGSALPCPRRPERCRPPSGPARWRPRRRHHGHHRARPGFASRRTATLPERRLRSLDSQLAQSARCQQITQFCVQRFPSKRRFEWLIMSANGAKGSDLWNRRRRSPRKPIERYRSAAVAFVTVFTPMTTSSMISEERAGGSVTAWRGRRMRLRSADKSCHGRLESRHVVRRDNVVF